MNQTGTTLFLLLLVLVGVLGLAIGSFLNVVIWRLPHHESLSHPPSACPKCGHAIRARDNIPVLSWLLLRRRCRDCGEPISARYPLVELGTAVFFGVVAWKFLPAAVSAPPSDYGAISAVLVLLAFLYLAAMSVVLALIDIDTHKLSNKIVLPSYVVGAVLLGGAGLWSASYPALLGAAIGAAALFVFYLVLALIYPRGMGFGDVKLAGVLGLYLGYLGWGPLVVGAFAAFLLGGLFSIGLLITRKAGRKSGIPFGPWMLAGAWVGIFFGKELAVGYLRLVGLS